jgi:hypothetical protein
MKYQRLWMKISVLALLATAVSGPSLHAQNNDDQGASGASYLTTVKTSAGAFASRGVITLHADHTMSVIDSGQGGPILIQQPIGLLETGGQRRGSRKSDRL